MAGQWQRRWFKTEVGKETWSVQVDGGGCEIRGNSWLMRDIYKIVRYRYCLTWNDWDAGTSGATSAMASDVIFLYEMDSMTAVVRVHSSMKPPINNNTQRIPKESPKNPQRIPKESWKECLSVTLMRDTEMLLIFQVNIQLRRIISSFTFFIS